MTVWTVQGGRPLRGVYTPSADPTLASLYLVLCSLGEGDGFVRGLEADAPPAIVHGLRALGVPIAATEQGFAVSGVGLSGLRMPQGALDAGHSQDALELLSVLLSAQPFGTRVVARGAAARANLAPLLHTLRARGAQVKGTSEDDGSERAPVAVAPLLQGEHLQPAELAIPGGDRAAKLAMLVSGLFAQGPSALSEEMLSADHTERALLALGLPVQTMGPMAMLELEATPSWQAFDWRVPGDFARAAFVLAAACGVPGSEVELESVGVNPSRAAWLGVLRQAGAQVQVTPRGDNEGGEPLSQLRVSTSPLRSLALGGELAFRTAADLPALCALSPAVQGRMQLRDLPQLRHHDPDRIKGISQVLGAFGVEHTAYQDGLDIDGGQRPTAAEVDTSADPALGPLALVLALAAEGQSRVVWGEDALYPELPRALQALGAQLEDGA